MAKWHISRDGKQLDQMEQQDLQAAVAAGQVLASDLVWVSGMPDWKRVSDVPEIAGPAMAASFVPGIASPVGVVNYQMPQSGTLMCTQTSLDSLRGTKPWVRFMGIMLFVIGGLCVVGGAVVLFSMAMMRGSSSRQQPWLIVILGLVYAIMALVYVVLGLYLNRYASSIAKVLTYRREDDLEAALESQRKFWRLAGMIVIIGFGLYFAFIGVVIVASMFKW